MKLTQEQFDALAAWIETEAADAAAYQIGASREHSNNWVKKSKAKELLVGDSNEDQDE